MLFRLILNHVPCPKLEEDSWLIIFTSNYSFQPSTKCFKKQLGHVSFKMMKPPDCI